jgi:hypothetical protein
MLQKKRINYRGSFVSLKKKLLMWNPHWINRALKSTYGYCNITHLTARFSPSTLSMLENSMHGTLSGSGCFVHTTSSGIGSNGAVVLIFFSFCIFCGSDRLRFTRSCDSCVKLIGDFHASKNNQGLVSHEFILQTTTILLTHQLWHQHIVNLKRCRIVKLLILLGFIL